MKTKFKFPLVVVEWSDAVSGDSWEVIPDKLEYHQATTVGFLVLEDDKHILLANSYDEDNITGTMQIPKGMILKKIIIKKGDTKNEERTEVVAGVV